jgi:hypothetical protein
MLSGLAATTWYVGKGGTSAVPRIRFGRSIRLLRADVEGFINGRITEAKKDVSLSTGIVPAAKRIYPLRVESAV